MVKINNEQETLIFTLVGFLSAHLTSQNQLHSEIYECHLEFAMNENICKYTFKHEDLLRLLMFIGKHLYYLSIFVRYWLIFQAQREIYECRLQFTMDDKYTQISLFNTKPGFKNLTH